MYYLSILYNYILNLNGPEIGDGPPEVPPPGCFDLACSQANPWLIVAFILGPLVIAGLGFVIVKAAMAKRGDSRAERDLIDNKNDEIDRLKAQLREQGTEGREQGTELVEDGQADLPNLEEE